jgi:hypothetical protein
MIIRQKIEIFALPEGLCFAGNLVRVPPDKSYAFHRNLLHRLREPNFIFARNQE